MNDYDSIKGIFEKNKSLTTEFTQQGFEFESNSDYDRARDCYQNALDQLKNQQLEAKIPSIEKELWEQSQLRCCNELTDWKEMDHLLIGDQKSPHQSSLSKLFKESAYSLESLFPFAFRAKIKLILQEKSEQEQKKTRRRGPVLGRA